MKLLALFIAIVLPLASSTAQQLLTPEPQRTAEAPGDRPEVVHVTDALNAMPETVAAIAEFRRLKAAGLLPAPGKAAVASDVGDTLNFRQLDLTTNDWLVRPFVLMAASSVANVWVAVSETDGADGNGHVTEADALDLSSALSESTPAGSYNPSAGIVVNNRAVFGDPPDVDGDGITDVLVYDINDGRTDGSYVAGFVTGADLPPSGPGNGRDVLHLDSNQGIFRRGVVGALATAAHELQHLIHLNYDTSEETFINEGLSEYAEIMNGYEARPMSYLGDAAEVNRSLFYWDGRIIDYQRAGLYISYLAQRTHPLTVGSITRELADGRSGLNNVLGNAGLSVEDVMVDFHTATYLNGTGLVSDPDLGLVPAFSSARVFVAEESIVDGRTASTTVRRDTVRGGGAVFRVWQNVEDFSLDIGVVNEPGQLEQLTLGRVGLRAIAEYESGTVEVRDLTVSVNPAIDTHNFPGVADRITLVLGHIKPVSSGAIGPTTTSDRVIYPYTATWVGGAASTLETTQYDTGAANGYFSVPSPQRFATRFDITDPDRMTLDHVEIAIYYLNQFSGGPDDESSPRDFTLHVWEDASGIPGAELFSKVITDTRPNQDVFSNDPLRFLEVDLSDESIGTLPAAVHIGASNAGTDGNTIVTALADYSDNVSSHFSAGSWSDMWSVQLSGGGDLNGQMAPVRLTVLVGQVVATEDEDVLPREISLSQNYPNPFNPATTISYSMPSTGDVRLMVYDVLGRQVATLVNGTMPAGRHEVSVDATGWASGLYVYSLEAGAERMTRNMVLLR